MPDAISHLIIASRLYPKSNQLGLSLSMFGMPSNGVIDKYLATGALGPDILFFAQNNHQELMNKLFDLLGYMIEFEDLIDDANTEITNATSGCFGLDQLANQLTNLYQTRGVVIVNQMLALGLTAHDWYCLESNTPDLQAGVPEAQWKWFDRLHYKKTWEFVRKMIGGANTQNQKLYSLGYLTHYTTDVAGHPFINAIAGNPFRLDWHRHALVEKWCAAQNRKFFSDSPVIVDYIKENIELNVLPGHSASNVKGSYYYGLIIQEELDDEIADLLNNTMTHVFSNYPALHPSEIKDSYNKWFKLFKYWTKGKIIHPPTPPTSPLNVVDPVFQDFLNSFPPGPTPTPGSNNLVFFLEHLCEYVQYLLDVILHILEFLATITLSLAINVAAWIVYYLNTAIYETYENLRLLIVLLGYYYPESQDLDNTIWGKCFINTSHVNQGPYQYFSYPYKVHLPPQPFDINHHLKYPYPGNQTENPHTRPCPRAFESHDADFIIEGVPTDNGYSKLLRRNINISPEATNSLLVDKLAVLGFGSSLEFTCSLLKDYVIPNLSMEELADMNMDGDRGYAYRTWSTADIHSDPIDVHYD